MDSDIRLARAALVALSGSVGASPALLERGISFLPENRPLTRPKAERYLAAMEKPLVCAAFSWANQLWIGTWHVPVLPEFVDEIVAFVRESFSNRQASADVVADVAITCDGGGLAELTYSEYELWLRQYRFPLASVSLTPTESSETELYRFVARVSTPATQAWLSGGEVRPDAP